MKRLITLISFFLLITSVQAQLLNFDLKKKKTSGEKGVGVSSKKLNLGEQIKEEPQKKPEAKDIESFALEGQIDPQEYLLGPNDILLVNLLGDMGQESYRIRIWAEGKASIPSVGTVNLAGVPFKEGKERIKKKIKEHFEKEVQVSVSLIGIRYIRVHVLGAVKKPGVYSLQANKRLSDAISLAGSTTTYGNLRAIQVYDEVRNDTLNIDYIEYLEEAKVSSNPYLTDGCVIMIPSNSKAQKKLYVYGGQRLKRVIAFKKEKDLSDVIEEVGASTERTALTNIKLVRGEKESEINYFEEPSHDLKAGDKIVISQRPDSIFVSGYVNRPGAYSFRSGYSFKEYVNIAGGITSDGSGMRVEVIRNGRKYDPDALKFVEPGDVITVKRSILAICRDYLEIISPIVSVLVTARAFDFFK